MTEITLLDGVCAEIPEKALREFHRLTLAQRFVRQGGANYAREALSAALGPAGV
jgi:flagellar motor switch protein FliG